VRKRRQQGSFTFEALGEGRFAIGGTCAFGTVTRILERSKDLFENEPVIKVDLSGVTQADSAGLSLLLEWINWALHYQREIHFSAIPQQVLDIARISEVEELLHSAERPSRRLVKPRSAASA
jgi:phospholipid transport system transporter-binding protein